MARRGAHEGSIRQRPDGRWEARYHGADGRSHSLLSKTRREVQERLRAALVATDHGVQLPGQRLRARQETTASDSGSRSRGMSV